MNQEIEQAVSTACKQLFDIDTAVELTRPDEQFGDYATNIALQPAGRLHKKPHEIAESLQAELTKTLAGKTETSVAGPGFLNFRLSDKALLGELGAQPVQSLSGKIYVIEY